MSPAPLRRHHRVIGYNIPYKDTPMTAISARPDPRRDPRRYELPLDQLFARALAVKAANWPDGAVQKSAPVDHDRLLGAAIAASPPLTPASGREADAAVRSRRNRPPREANGADRFCMGAAWHSLKTATCRKLQG